MLLWQTYPSVAAAISQRTFLLLLLLLLLLLALSGSIEYIDQASPSVN
jgi:hypothetical protein